LAGAFNCGVNDLPLSMILSWYEQKAVCILLTLLPLGIKNIKLGPTLPAFISPAVLNVLVE
jgi:hydroxylamine reductase